MSIPDRDRVLEGLASVGTFGAKAEASSAEALLHSTLPIPAHLNALEPEVLLVLGGRGAGKSHLFRLLNLPQGVNALDPTGSRQRLERAIWLRTFSTRPETSASSTLRLPSEMALQQFAMGKSRTDLMGFWWGLLAGSALAQDDEQSRSLLCDALPDSLIQTLTSDNLPRISGWHGLLMAHIEDIEAAFNALDDELARQNRYLFATYDDLDVMAVEWDEKRALIQALLQFWLGQWRRWRRMRPKIFLRLDLFAPEFLNFPDASKLEGNKLVLRWTPNQLYQLVLKAWANQNDPSCAFLAQQAGIAFNQDPVLGMYTSSLSEADLRVAIHCVLGEFMGKGPKKGRTFIWIPNHLQDANGEIFPRSMLHLFALAAEDEMRHRRAKDNLLLSPESFGAAIEQVSEHRIKELQEEYPWLEFIRPKLDGQQVPLSREAMASLLGEVTWGKTSRPPLRQNPELLIEDLLKVGIFRLTADRRIHVPDIYLYGFGLKRKGGIQRPRREHQ